MKNILLSGLACTAAVLLLSQPNTSAGPATTVADKSAHVVHKAGEEIDRHVIEPTDRHVVEPAKRVIAKHRPKVHVVHHGS